MYPAPCDPTIADPRTTYPSTDRAVRPTVALRQVRHEVAGRSVVAA